MGKDKPLKSSYELAMERLRDADREAGEEDRAPLTDAQKKKIAELRRAGRARLAELEIMRNDRLAAAGIDPEKIQEVEEHFRTDRRRAETKLEADIARVRRGEDLDDE